MRAMKPELENDQTYRSKNTWRKFLLNFGNGSSGNAVFHLKETSGPQNQWMYIVLKQNYF